MTSELIPGDQVRVMIYRHGRHVSNYNGVFMAYAKNKKVRLRATDGRIKHVAPDHVRKIT